MDSLQSLIDNAHQNGQQQVLLENFGAMGWWITPDFMRSLIGAFAALALGLVTVPIFVNDRPGNAEWILGDGECRVLLIDGPEQWAALAPVRERLARPAIHAGYPSDTAVGVKRRRGAAVKGARRALRDIGADVDMAERDVVVGARFYFGRRNRRRAAGLSVLGEIAVGQCDVPLVG